MLYWGEGDKTKDYFVALTNTNPDILVYFIKWLRKYFDIDEKRLRCRLYLWKNLDEDRAKFFWSNRLDIPLDQFTKTYFSSSVSKVRKKKHEFGICRISYGSKKIMSDINLGIKSSFC